MVVKQQSRFQSQNIQSSFMYINLPQTKQTSFKGPQDQNCTLSPLQATLFENTVLDVFKFTGPHSHCLSLNIKSDSVEKKRIFFFWNVTPCARSLNLQLYWHDLKHQPIKRLSVVFSGGVFTFVFPAIAIRRHQGPSMLGGFHLSSLSSSRYLTQETPSWLKLLMPTHMIIFCWVSTISVIGSQTPLQKICADTETSAKRSLMSRILATM